MKKSGGLFDFDCDGRVSIGEEALGLAALLGALSELESDRVRFEFELEDDDFEELDCAGQEARLRELRRRRDELDVEEPDDLESESYDAWEERCEELEEKIEELEELLNG